MYSAWKIGSKWEPKHFQNMFMANKTRAHTHTHLCVHSVYIQTEKNCTRHLYISGIGLSEWVHCYLTTMSFALVFPPHNAHHSIHCAIYCWCYFEVWLMLSCCDRIVSVSYFRDIIVSLQCNGDSRFKITLILYLYILDWL